MIVLFFNTCYKFINPSCYKPPKTVKYSTDTGKKNYGKHQPSAIFEVVSVVKKGDNLNPESEIFMSVASAEFLDIPDPVKLGVFDVTLRLLPLQKK